MAGAVAVMSGVLISCAGPAPQVSACSPALTRSIDTIEARVTTEGTLRHARTYQRGPEAYFISAELLPRNEAPDHDGQILTWFTTDPAGSDFRAVDTYARRHSSWPEASFDVREEGAITSRGCLLPRRGQPSDDDCAPGFEQFC